MDFCVQDIGNTDNNKFFGEITFEEWSDINIDSSNFNIIKYVHEQKPTWTYDDIINYSLNSAASSIVSNKKYIEEYGLEHPNIEEFSSMMKNVFYNIRYIDILSDVKPTDDLGHGIITTMRLGEDKISTIINRSIYEQMDYMALHGWKGCRTKSSVLRMFIAIGISLANEIEFIGNHILSANESNMDLLMSEQIDIKAKEHQDIITDTFKSKNDKLENIMESEFLRDIRIKETAEEIIDLFNKIMSRPSSVMNNGDFRYFISKNVIIRRILYNLRNEGFIDNEYVDSVIKEGRIPQKNLEDLKAKFNVIEYGKVDNRKCHLCGSNSTYIMGGKPQWYKFKDRNGNSIEDSYLCKPCYRKNSKNKYYKSDKNDELNRL